MITFMIPIPLHDPYPQGTVIFLVDEGMLTDLIWDIIGDYQGGVYILNADHQILASRDRGLGLSVTDMDSILNNATHSNLMTIQLGNQEVSAVSAQSDITGWTFISVMPTDQFFDRVIERRTFVFYLIAVMFLAGFALAILFSRTYYKPILKTSELTRKYWGQIVYPKKHDELGRIERTIMTAYESQRDLESQIIKQRPFVRDQFLLNLLRGDFIDKEEIDKNLDPHFPPFVGEYFFVLYIELSQKGKPALETKTLINRLEFPEGISHGIELMMGDIALICNVKVPSEEVQKHLVDHVLDRLFEEGAVIQPTLGVGKIYGDITLINRSYVEATAAIEYKIKVDRGTPIYYADIQDYEHNTHWYPLKEQYKLSQSLKQGDMIVAQESLTEIIGTIKSQGQSFLLLKCMCFDVINTILKIMNDLKIKEFSNQIKELIEYRTLEELEENLQTLIKEICERISNDEESDKQALIHQIQSYIHEKYRNDQLNLDEVAERFHLSSSYLSRFFKEQTGFTFTDYVIHLRIEEVKQQLIQSDKPIKEIILNAGYNNVSSFSRRFKQLEGITPGQYREIASQQLHDS
ncbi:MAG: AraC family transcriptional regulator [Paenibacillus sp.]|jgi:AraC-like DNA-binding protein|nr:AraC family transcriptional regulator [Paenibacillus sp.]